MPWRELILDSSGDDAHTKLFTTATLRWQPRIADDPHGEQIATLWGDPPSGAFAVVVRVPTDPPDVYRLIRRDDRGFDRQLFARAVSPESLK